MKLFFKAKDGGPESNVTGYWLIESKETFSIVLLCFDKGSREAYHNHAFDAISWVLHGLLMEDVRIAPGMHEFNYLSPSIIPIITRKTRFHRVEGMADKTWVISFRGPWTKRWNEFLIKTNQFITLTNGRKLVPQ